ncbi:hypothetical protein K523DRAFT_422472 [Schizophyllum commune Tattone D]|nr:hypothetical protein K523DRAFT_422472 [Schizophyllum commune Tattone D]
MKICPYYGRYQERAGAKPCSSNTQDGLLPDHARAAIDARPRRPPQLPPTAPMKAAIDLLAPRNAVRTRMRATSRKVPLCLTSLQPATSIERR